MDGPFPTDDDPFLVAEEVSAKLRVPLGTLYQWRFYGVGPKAIKSGRRLLYRSSAIEAHIAQLEQQEETRRQVA